MTQQLVLPVSCQDEIRNHLINHDAHGLACYLKLDGDVCATACDSWRSIGNKFGELMAEAIDTEVRMRINREYQKHLAMIIKTLVFHSAKQGG